MKLTIQKLKKMGACESGVEWFKKHGDVCAGETFKNLMDCGKLDWALWIIPNSQLKTKTALKLAELVLPIYENKYPNDDRPRKAIAAAKTHLINPTHRNRELLKDAAHFAARKATRSAARNATYSAADAAGYAADATCCAVRSAYANKNTKLLNTIVNIIAKELEYQPRSKHAKAKH